MAAVCPGPSSVRNSRSTRGFSSSMRNRAYSGAPLQGEYSNERRSPLHTPTTMTGGMTPRFASRVTASSTPQSTPVFAMRGSKRFCPSCM